MFLQGDLTLLKTLNREAQFFYVLAVTATSSEDSSLVGHTVVRIFISVLYKLSCMYGSILSYLE